MMSETTKPRGLERLAFWGRTNSSHLQAARAIAYQYRQCSNCITGKSIIVVCYYECAEPVTESLRSAVSDFGDLPQRDGGWDNLVSAVARPDRNFTTVICDQPTSVSRNPGAFLRRLRILHDHNIALLIAYGPTMQEKLEPYAEIPFPIQIQLGI